MLRDNAIIALEVDFLAIQVIKITLSLLYWSTIRLMSHCWSKSHKFLKYISQYTKFKQKRRARPSWGNSSKICTKARNKFKNRSRKSRNKDKDYVKCRNSSYRNWPRNGMHCKRKNSKKFWWIPTQEPFSSNRRNNRSRKETNNPTSVVRINVSLLL